MSTPVGGFIPPEQIPGTQAAMQPPAHGSQAPIPPHIQTVMPAPSAPVSRFSREDIFLNIALYVGSLFLIGSAALFVSTMSSAIQAIMLGLGALLCYSAGLICYSFVPRLRLASYSFTATGLALLPLSSVAIYTFKLWDNGGMLWLLTSLVGTAAVVLASSLMRNRLMGYVLISFIVSDALSATKVAGAPFVWYFLSLTILAMLLSLLLRYAPTLVPTGLRTGIVDASRIFVPGTAAAMVFFTEAMSHKDMAVVLGVMSLYALLFTLLETRGEDYLQLRLYPVFATALALHEEASITIWTATALVILLSCALASLLFPYLSRAAARAPKEYPVRFYSSKVDAYISAVAGAITLFSSYVSIAVLQPPMHSSAPGLIEALAPHHFDHSAPYFSPWVLSLVYLGMLLAMARYLDNPGALLAYSAVLLLSLITLNVCGGLFLLCMIYAAFLILARVLGHLNHLQAVPAAQCLLLVSALDLYYLLIDEPVAGDFIALAAVGLCMFAAISLVRMPKHLVQYQPAPRAGHPNLLVQPMSTPTIEMHFYMSLACIALFFRLFIPFGMDTAGKAVMGVGLVLLCSLMLSAMSAASTKILAAQAERHAEFISYPVISASLLVVLLGFLVDEALPSTLLTLLYVVCMSAFAFVLVPDSIMRSVLLVIARLSPIAIVIQLMRQENIRIDGALLLLGGFAAIQAAVSWLIAMRGSSSAKRNFEIKVFNAAFYALALLAVSACLFSYSMFVSVDRVYMSALVLPALTVLFALGAEFFPVSFDRSASRLILGAALPLSFMVALNRLHIFGYDLGLLSEESVYRYFMGAFLSLVIILVLKAALKQQVRGQVQIRPRLMVTLPGASTAIAIPVEGPLLSATAYMRALQGSFTQRVFSSANREMLYPLSFILPFLGLLTLGSANNFASACSLALAATVIALITAPQFRHIAAAAIPVVFFSRLIFADGFYPVEFALLIMLTVIYTMTIKYPLTSQAMPASQRAQARKLSYITLGIMSTLTLCYLFLFRDMQMGSTRGVTLVALAALMVGAAALYLSTIWTGIAAALVAANVALALNQLNALALFIASLMIIGGVIWRLLSREQGSDSAQSFSVQGAQAQTMPYQPMPYQPVQTQQIGYPQQPDYPQGS
ncbi:MAG: hypothetical protein Q4P78_01945 [Rothia sp. (in: high G+C Gram-positive bacteria)]|uniref:hypothetical protein n=1 Tax=Rothia sp. (in: high G+C Gram-positive bacteria) TaxID=1885016 RepID=UPI0026DF6763|nr:hypothetical protein [Rothia sp. (in: high G+C Gram-positive bacteria)]MDO5749947.1 hypothetical protein [Rothia sp. (in: high G+C Gram-positive bacteria)]